MLQIVHQSLYRRAIRFGIEVLGERSWAGVVLSGVGRSLGVIDFGTFRNVILVAGGFMLGNRIAASRGNAAPQMLDGCVASAIVINEEIDRIGQQRDRQYQANDQQLDSPTALLLLARGLQGRELVAAAPWSGRGLGGGRTVGRRPLIALGFRHLDYSY